LLPEQARRLPVEAWAPMKGFWEFWLVAALAIAVTLVALIAWTLR
jgi:hypothetical protein